MTRISRHFREVFSAPHLWRGIQMCIPGAQKRPIGDVDVQVLETIKLRGITQLTIRYNYNYLQYQIKDILLALPQLEMLSFDYCVPTTVVDALEQAASSVHLNLKRLDLQLESIQPVNILCDQKTCGHVLFDLLQKLPRLEHFCCGHTFYSQTFLSLKVSSLVCQTICDSRKYTPTSPNQGRVFFVCTPTPWKIPFQCHTFLYKLSFAFLPPSPLGFPI